MTKLCSRSCWMPPYQHSVIPLLVFLDDTLVSASWWSFFLSRIFLFLIFYLRARVFSQENNTIFPSIQKQLYMIKKTAFSDYNSIVLHIHLSWSTYSSVPNRLLFLISVRQKKKIQKWITYIIWPDLCQIRRKKKETLVTKIK